VQVLRGNRGRSTTAPVSGPSARPARPSGLKSRMEERLKKRFDEN
jgi:hypothetical protein